MLIKGYELREMADYKMYNITGEDAEAALKRAEEFVDRVVVYLDGFFLEEQRKMAVGSQG